MHPWTLKPIRGTSPSAKTSTGGRVVHQITPRPALLSVGKDSPLPPAHLVYLETSPDGRLVRRSGAEQHKTTRHERKTTMQTFYPGTEVVVFDPRLYVDDIKTPLSITLQRATVVCWYGQRANKILGDYVYPSLIDVKLHRNGRISHGHFTDCIREVISIPLCV